jgi:hypothetical protein
VRDVLEVAHQEARGLELAAAQVTAPHVRLERRRFEADLAVQQLVDLVRKKVSFHGSLYGRRTE